MENNLNAQKELMVQRVRFAKGGILLALLAGLGQGFNASMTGLASELYPFADPTYTVWMLIICSFICSGLHDFFSGCWILIFNKASKRSITEYIRLLKTRVGRLLIVGGMLGGPVATGSSMAATYLCGPTYSLAISGIFPIIGTLCGVLFLKEKITVRTWIGIVIAMIGVFLISYSPPSGESYPFFGIGLIFAFICAIGWGTEGAFVSYAGDMVDPNIGVGLFRSFGSAIVLLFLFVPITGILGGVGADEGFKILSEAVGAGTPVAIMAVAALGGGTSMYVFYQALNRCGISRTMCLNITSGIWSIPICIILEAAGLMDYDVSVRAIVGVFVVVFGTILSLSSPKELISLRKN